MSFDPSALDAYRAFMGEEAQAFIAEIIQTFIENAPKLVASAEEAAQAGDQETFVRAAHTLKSNSATLGAPVLASLAAELERDGKDGDLNSLNQKLEEAKKELARVIEAIKMNSI